MPPERELSLDFGVSRAMIRAAIRDLAAKGLVEMKPRCRPVVAGSAPQRGWSAKRHIGIWLWPNTADYAAASILKGIQSADLGSDVRLQVANAVGSDWESKFNSEASFLNSLAEDPESAGAIVWYLGGRRNLSSLLALGAAEVPTVFVDRLPPAEIAADFVGTDNESAVRRTVHALYSLGHRRIAMLSNIEPVSSVQERETGYRRAMQSLGAPVSDGYIARDKVDDRNGVEAALEGFLGLEEPPTAIFAVNDHIALQLCEVLQERKILVPQEMSVVGFDGILRWLPGGGRLTTHLQDFERVGRLAAEITQQRITNGPPSVFRHVLLDAPLFDGGTVGPPRKESRFHCYLSS